MGPQQPDPRTAEGLASPGPAEEPANRGWGRPGPTWGILHGDHERLVLQEVLVVLNDIGVAEQLEDLALVLRCQPLVLAHLLHRDLLQDHQLLVGLTQAQVHDAAGWGQGLSERTGPGHHPGVTHGLCSPCCHGNRACDPPPPHPRVTHPVPCHPIAMATARAYPVPPPPGCHTPADPRVAMATGPVHLVATVTRPAVSHPTPRVPYARRPPTTPPALPRWRPPLARCPPHPKAPLPTTRIRSYFSITAPAGPGLLPSPWRHFREPLRRPPADKIPRAAPVPLCVGPAGGGAAGREGNGTPRGPGWAPLLGGPPSATGSYVPQGSTPG